MYKVKNVLCSLASILYIFVFVKMSQMTPVKRRRFQIDKKIKNNQENSIIFVADRFYYQIILEIDIYNMKQQNCKSVNSD